MKNINTIVKYIACLSFLKHSCLSALLGFLLVNNLTQTANAQCDPGTCKQVCQGSLATFNIQAIPRPNTAGYGLIYFLTDVSGIVIESTADLGGLTAPTSYTFATYLNTPGTYYIHALSYNLSDPPIPIPTTGTNISTVGSISPGCHEWGENANNMPELCLVVNPTPPVLTHTLTACETIYGTGTASFVLTDADAILGAGGYTVTYHQTRVDALNNTNALTSPYTSGTTTLYARVAGTTAPFCSSISTLNLTVLSMPNAAFTVASFCSPGPSAPAIISGVAGGTFSISPSGGGVSINASTGVISGATAGTTYTVTYSVTAGGCTNTSTATAIAYDCTCVPVAKCVGEPLCATDGGFTPPAGYTQLFILTDAAGTIVAMNTTGTFPSEFLAAAPTLYNIHTLVYNTTNAPVALPTVGANISSVGSTYRGCYNDNFTAERVCYTLNPLPPAATNPTNGRYCSGSPVVAISVDNPGAGNMIDWYADLAGTIPATGTLGPNGSTILLDGVSPALPPVGGTVVVYARVRNVASGCVSTTLVPVSLTHVPSDDANFTIAPFCAPGSSSLAIVTGVLGGSFTLVSSTAPGPPVVDPLTGRITGVTGPGTIDIRYQTSGECPANVVKTITALNCPCPATIDICQGDPLCTTSTSPATDPYRLIFYLTDVNGIIQAISTTYTPPGTPVTNQFTGVPAGDGYKVYILSYYNGFFPYDVVPTVGSSITANLGDNSPCYNPDFLSDYYCYNVKPQPYAEPTAADLCRSTVAGSTVTLFGNPSAANTFAWARVLQGLQLPISLHLLLRI